MMDWNPIVHVLDELSDGTQLFREFRQIASRYDRKSFVNALLFLAERELIILSSKYLSSKPVPSAERPLLLIAAFESDIVDPDMMANISISLTEKGEEILRLLGVGHP